MEDLKIKIGDIVPYINTRQKVCKCKITSFEDGKDNKRMLTDKVWFYGIDIKTNAKVFRPLHKSIGLLIAENTNSDFYE